MVLITIAVFAGLLLAGQTYVNPQRVSEGARAETLLAERNRINLALRAYLGANRVPVPVTGWQDAIGPFLEEPVRPLPTGLSWTLRAGPDGGDVCLDVAGADEVPSRAEPILCALSGPSACLSPRAVGLIGEPGWTGCEGMLIVSTGMLRSAGSPLIGGDGSFDLTGPDGQEYGFSAGPRTVYTGQATDLSGLFRGTGYNGDVSGWVTSNVTDMSDLFRDATLFNQPIGSWDTSRVTAMGGAFAGATAFNRDLSGWCVPLIGAKPDQFDDGATSWSQPKPLWGTCPVTVTIGLADGSPPSGQTGSVYPGYDFTTLLTISGASASELSWSSSGAPTGLSLSSAGVLSGTPTEAGTFLTTVSATHPGGASGSRSYTIVIGVPASVTLSAGSVPDGERGVPYDPFDLVPFVGVTGASPSELTWSAVGVPAGMSLSGSGVLSGTPTGVGYFPFTVTVTHPAGPSDSEPYAIIVNDPDGALIVEP